MSNNNKGKALDNVSGSNDEDLVTGTGSAEKVDAKAAADVAAGGAGDDWVKGGSGDDSIDGSAGSDQVDGGSGNDRLLYTVGENTGETDSYDGGSGANTLVLTMTKAEWMRDDVQADIAAYLLFLASTAPSANGQNSSAGFLFSSLGLTARRFTSLEVLVDGVPQDPRDETIVARDDESVTSTEHSVVVGNVTDNDDVPDLVRAVELVAGPDKGSLVLNQDGSYVYDPGNAFDSLAEGEIAEISFTYKVSDADRDSATATARITIVGTNDVPIANVDIGTTDENQALLVDALANDADVDASDTHTVQSAVIASGLGAVAIVNNQIEWKPGTDYDYLALNESATVTVDYVMGDDKGATDSSTLTITVVGSNDAPVANADTASADENQTLMVDVLVNDT
ncbi:MAG: Ig-like domain-containing protein, partial [Pseudohongiellaceae bacterium]